MTRGRPREFCTDAALTAALGVFWAKGYDGTSMADLTAAMGITKPSLYAAFGNKEQLFHRALDRYGEEKLSYVREALAQPTARAVAEHLMRGAVAAQTSNGDPRGCLGVISATAGAAEVDSIREHVQQRRLTAHAELVARFRAAQDAGDLDTRADPEALAQYLYTILQGMAVQASSGATRAELARVVDTSLAMWPSG